MRITFSRITAFTALAAGASALAIPCPTATATTEAAASPVAAQVSRPAAPHKSGPPTSGQTTAPSRHSARPEVATPASSPQATLPTQLSVDAAHLPMVLFGVNGTIGADGSMGDNLQYGNWYSLGEQNAFGHLLHAAVFQDTTEMTSVVRAVEYTYAHQNADGSWPSRPLPDSTYPPGGGFVGTAFFYGDLGRGLGLLQDSAWFQKSAQTTSLRARLDALAPKIALGLHWLGMDPSHWSVLGMGRQDTNRGAAAAEGFLLVGQWLNNTADIALGEQLLLQVEANQLPDGTIVENGGFDPGYQVVSLNHLWDIYFHLAGDLLSYRPAVWAELTKGLAKEQTVVSSSGAIDFSHATRTGCGGETYHGQPKAGGGEGLSRVLVYTASTTGKDALLSEAQSVIKYYATHSHSHCA